HRASAMRVIDRIALPALIITAEDDPFVPSQPFHDPKITTNPNIDLRLCAHGGHCGFVSAASAGDARDWRGKHIVDFVSHQSQVASRESVTSPQSRVHESSVADHESSVADLRLTND